MNRAQFSSVAFVFGLCVFFGTAAGEITSVPVIPTECPLIHTSMPADTLSMPANTHRMPADTHGMPWCRHYASSDRERVG